MAERLTAEELAAMRARCEVALLGPWSAAQNIGTGEWTIDILFAPDVRGDFYGRNLARADGESIAQFIAHARTDLPRALDEIEHLQAERDAAVAREAVLADALRDARDRAGAIASETGGWVKHRALLIERGASSVLADPSPAARRYAERVAALERFWQAWERTQDASLGAGPEDDNDDPDLHPAAKALRALDEAPR